MQATPWFKTHRAPRQISTSAPRICRQVRSVPSDSEPPRKLYGFKPKEFERVNAPRPESSDTPAEPTPPANDVFAIQRDLRAREIAAGMDEIAPPPRPVSTKRRRDYWLLMLLGNGLFVPLALYGLRASNPVLAVYALAGATLFSLGLSWVMWAVMSRY